jgi:hypothetical protein
MIVPEGRFLVSMNIFYLDYNEKKCAAYHCDKHVNKMIIEHLQMMSVALAHYGYPPAKKKDGNYYSTRAYKNHPCTKWVKASSSNFLWLFSMTKYLCIEFERRYGKRHAGQTSLVGLVEEGTLSNLMDQDIYPHVGHTPPALAMPDYCKHPDPIVAYRTYYNLEKWEFASWDKTDQGEPPWWAPACYNHRLDCQLA